MNNKLSSLSNLTHCKFNFNFTLSSLVRPAGLCGRTFLIKMPEIAVPLSGPALYKSTYTKQIKTNNVTGNCNLLVPKSNNNTLYGTDLQVQQTQSIIHLA